MRGLPDQYAPFANEILKQGWVQPNKRIFNNAKISDHFAIIPTGTAPKSLSDAEQDLRPGHRRFLAVFYPAAEYNITTRITRVERSLQDRGQGAGQSGLAGRVWQGPQRR
jgi:DNA topoisomerase-3